VAAKPKPRFTCFYCKEEGHWKPNCPKYLEDKKASKIDAKYKGICDIHVYLKSAWSEMWVFDTGFVSHICNSQQNLQSKRCLVRKEVIMHVGNGSRVDVVDVGTLPL
jgi:hypothetical protein